MSRRRRRGLLQTRDYQFNYRYGNPAMRKRYRVRNKRRLIIAACGLLVLLILLGILLSHLFGHDEAAPEDGTSPDQTTMEEQLEEQSPEESPSENEQEPPAESEPEQHDLSQLPPFVTIARPAAETAANGPSETAGGVLVNARLAVTGSVVSKEDDWRLLLVNPSHPLSDGYSFEPLTLQSGLVVDARMADELDQMYDDCAAAGYSPQIITAYRSSELQQQLFDGEKEKWINQGYSEDEAYDKAADVLAIPGTSEHETGLAVDIVDSGYPYTDDNQADTETQKWLTEHCWEYGFVLRYPADKTDVTGMKHESWHYRYVGKENAKAMHESGQCLEEFLGR